VNDKINAVICDFGLSRFQETEVKTQRIIDIKGFSPRYTAPEVFGRVMANITSVSIQDEMKGDVYSYAIILWQMMTRKTPWAHCMILFSFILIIVIIVIIILVF